MRDFETSLFYEAYREKEVRVGEKVKRMVEEVDLRGFPFEALQGVVTNEELGILVRERPESLKEMSMMSGIRPTAVYQTTIVWRRLQLEGRKAGVNEKSGKMSEEYFEDGCKEERRIGSKLKVMSRSDN